VVLVVLGWHGRPGSLVLRSVKVRTTISPALLIGLLLGVYGTVALTVVIVQERAIGPWELFHQGCSFAGIVLVAAGLFEIVPRLFGMARRGVQIAAWLLVVEAVWMLVRLALSAGFANTEHLAVVWEWAWRVSGAWILIVTILLSIASRAWRRNPVAPVFGVLACAISGWTPYIGEKIFAVLFERHQLLYNLYWPLREVVWVLAMLAMLHLFAQDCVPAQPEPRAAALGLRRAAGALACWCFAVGVIAGLAVGATGASVIAYAGPAVIVVAVAAAAWAILAVERAGLAGMPRLRLVLGAALLLAWAGIYANRIAVRYSAEQLGQTVDSSSWVVIGPLIGAIGLALIGSALAAYVSARHHELRGHAAMGLVLYVVFAALGLASSLVLLLEPPTGVIATVATALFGMIALAALAVMFLRVSRAIDGEPGFPAARLV
jgi:hypothetical protein